jgi:hypothetical protein
MYVFTELNIHGRRSTFTAQCSPEVHQQAALRPSTAVVSPPGLDLARLADYMDGSPSGILVGPFTAVPAENLCLSLTTRVRNPLDNPGQPGRMNLHDGKEPAARRVRPRRR